MASDQLFNVLQMVDGETTFIRFVELLAAERDSADKLPPTLDGFQGAWANQTIADFLRAGAAWAEDSEFGVRPGPKPTNPWQLFATFLWAGRGYE
ncbi:hypothetical protein [Pseudoxanthomonas sp. JBR18]|jgi:hypothetical protein|uniref:DUF7660 family protein n=1 Tax=Pseudoxanthomonas sp. JBR18 TaxID=2969308 RepID=UPI002305C63E|nr:hypothetical protein [Pseudoxanthomonas sp. JBR18]WCE05977.1 hypothetical protein PJ250_08520 [Pseudoxanthomonas sp. JBR18]